MQGGVCASSGAASTAHPEPGPLSAPLPCHPRDAPAGELPADWAVRLLNVQTLQMLFHLKSFLLVIRSSKRGVLFCSGRSTDIFVYQFLLGCFLEDGEENGNILLRGVYKLLGSTHVACNLEYPSTGFVESLRVFESV